MKVMVMVKATKNSEAGILPNERLLSEMGRFNEALVEAGILLAGEGLHPTSRGKRVRFTGGRRSVEDGPFTDSKDLVAGFWIWRVRSMDEALDWARRCPNPMPGEDAELEIRPIYDTDDFGAAATPEIREREERLRKDVDRQKRP